MIAAKSDKVEKSQSRKRRPPEDGLLPNCPVYVFAIDGERLGAFKDTVFFQQSKFYKKWFGDRAVKWIRRSTQVAQTCYRGKLFFTHEPKFVPNLGLTNHNPLTPSNVKCIPAEFRYGDWEKPSLREAAWILGKHPLTPTPSTLYYTIGDHLLSFNKEDLTESCSFNLGELHEAFSGEGFEENIMTWCHVREHVEVPTFWNAIHAFIECVYESNCTSESRRMIASKVHCWLNAHVDRQDRNDLMTFALTIGFNVARCYEQIEEDRKPYVVFPKYYKKINYFDIK